MLFRAARTCDGNSLDGDPFEEKFFPSKPVIPAVFSIDLKYLKTVNYKKNEARMQEYDFRMI